MAENHIIEAKYSKNRYFCTRAVTRYDYGQILRFVGFDLPDAFEVHFALTGSPTSITQIGTNDEVSVPDELIRTNATIKAWLYLHDDVTDGETVYTIDIPVTDRAEPSDQEPTPVEQSVIDQTIAALNSAVDKAGEYADLAEQSAAQSGYLWFYMEDGDIYLDRTPNTNVDFYMENGDLYMEVIE